MSDYEGNLSDTVGPMTTAVEHGTPDRKKEQQEENDPVARVSVNFLDNGDSLIYAIVGVCFLIGGLIALGYAIWDFTSTIAGNWPINPPQLASAIIQFISDLLLALIIMEVLGTVTNYLRSHTTSLRPFLFIGIISATRGILSIGARLSVESLHPPGQQEFFNDMIELGVNGAVILALGVTIKLLGRLSDD